MDGSPIVKRLSLELHTDGSGVYGVQVASMNDWRPQASNEGELRTQLVSDEWIAIGVLSDLVHLARHARDRAAAGGTALVRAQLVPICHDRPTEIGHRGLFIEPLSSHAPPAEAAAPLDGLAEPGPEVVSAAALLVDELGRAFGIPDGPIDA
ncbi:MAG: hypothetical protein ACRDRQ_26595 [Pseudonocardiaceae bacterium]